MGLIYRQLTVFCIRKYVKTAPKTVLLIHRKEVIFKKQ